MSGARQKLQHISVASAAGAAGRAVVTTLRRDLAAYGCEGAQAVQAAFGLLEAEGLLVKKQANAYLDFLCTVETAADGKHARFTLMSTLASCTRERAPGCQRHSAARLSDEYLQLPSFPLQRIPVRSRWETS